MSDYCDCGFHPEIEVLSLDHQHMLALTTALQRACTEHAADADIEALFDELESVLGPHTQREESGIFDALRQVKVDEDYVERFEHDHTGIEEALAAARRNHGAVRTFAQLLEAHIRAEENDMWPAAHQLFAPSNWDEIERDIARPQIP